MESTPVKAAKSLRSKCWFVRSDGTEEYLRQKCGELARWIDVEAVLAVYHIGGSKENPHCHAVINMTSELQKQSFDKRIKLLFGIEKRSQYSTKHWDGVRDAGASSYIFHEEDAKILVAKNWSEAELDAAKATNAAVQKVVAVNKERSSTKLVDKAVEYFSSSKPTRGEVLRYMLKECRDGGSYYPGSYNLKKYVEEVVLKLTDGTDFEYFAAEMEAQLWRNF